MTWFWYAIAALAYTAVVFVAGTKYGNKMEQDAWNELHSLRGRLAAQIKGKD